MATNSDVTCSNVLEYALLILNTSSSEEKARLTLEAVNLYKNGKIPIGDPNTISSKPPDIPARPSNIIILPPNKMEKRGKGGSIKSRVALVHSFCHIESYAIDLAWDILIRFSLPLSLINKNSKISEKIHKLIYCVENNNFDLLEQGLHLHNHGVTLPKEFFEDWLRIAGEEAHHHQLWSNRLKELGSYYGALPCHTGLWNSAYTTSDDILARLAIVHMVLEGRGLDVAPLTKKKLLNIQDYDSLNLAEIIEHDEISHVASGLRWFKYICENKDNPIHDPKKEFQNIVSKRFYGKLKPPFNKEARDKALFDESWYLPLSK